MSQLTNDFTWSYSRHQQFQTCLRKYYYTYYGSWGGWDELAPHTARTLYTLKKLSTRFQWAGSHAHRAIELFLNSELPGATDTIIQEELHTMRQEFRLSRTKSYWNDPVHTIGLLEHEYNIPVENEEWKELSDRIGVCLQHFEQSPVWAELKQLPKAAWLGIEKKDSFLLNGLKVFLILDAIIQTPGGIVIYDWKTGTGDMAEYKHQLGVYAVYAKEKWPANSSFTGTLYNPFRQETLTYTFSDTDIEEYKEFILDSAEEMLFPLVDTQRNLAKEDDFDCTDNTEACENCPFLKCCPRWAGMLAK